MRTDNNILQLCKTKETGRSLDLRCKVLIVLSTVCILSSIVSAVPLPEDLNSVTTSVYDADPNGTSPDENDLLMVQNPITDTTRKLWQSRITPLKNSKSDTSKTDIEALIKQVNSIGFRPQNQAPEPIFTLEPIMKDKPAKQMPADETAPATIVTQAPEPEKPEYTISDNRIQSTQIREQTLQVFRDMLQKPGLLENPRELAEILFNSNCLPEAAICYRQALDRITADDAVEQRSKAWLLFQLGNCLRNDDPQTAIQTYKQLTQECPDSSWADLANAKVELIDWHQKNETDTLISKPKLQALAP